MSKLRIFVTTSHISTIYLTLAAKSTARKEYRDLLFIDTGIRRLVLLTLINETSSFHTWSGVHSFSKPVDEQHDFKPTRYKRFIRKAKGLPVIRYFYGLFLDRWMNRQNEVVAQKLRLILGDAQPEEEIELFLMTQTYLNRPLKLIFPDATIQYMEHGIGDYYYALQQETPTGNMYCLFSNPYRLYLKSQGIPEQWVFDMPGREQLQSFMRQLFYAHQKTIQADQLPTPQLPIVLILLEAVDMYNVENSFWTEYLNYMLSQIETPEQYHFLLKPHPMHSKHSVERAVSFFGQRNLSFDLLGDDRLSSLSAEVLFVKWQHQVRHVFCLFSSSCFYLSQVYPEQQITYWYSAEFMSKHINNAPPQYYKLFTEIRPLIDQVFSERCRAY